MLEFDCCSGFGGFEVVQGFHRRPVCDKVVCLNLPQALRYGYAHWFYEEVRRRGLLGKMEPHTTSLMFAIGEKVWVLEGLHR